MADMWAFLEGRPADDSFRRLTACHVKVPSFISTAALCWMILPTVRVLVPMKESITCRTYFVDCVYSVAFRVQVVCMTECLLCCFCSCCVVCCLARPGIGSVVVMCDKAKLKPPVDVGLGFETHTLNLLVALLC